jgi:hypothetical protein
LNPRPKVLLRRPLRACPFLAISLDALEKG